MKYKVGDKVRLKNGLMNGVEYGGLSYFDNMDKFKGKVLTISEIDKDGDYHIEGDLCWCYSDEMLEPVETKEKQVIMAKHLTNDDIFFWNYDGEYHDEDYAIVENEKDIALVKVIGHGVITDEKIGHKKVKTFLDSKEWK